MMGSGGMGIMGFNLGGGTPAWEVVNELRNNMMCRMLPVERLIKGIMMHFLLFNHLPLDNEKMDELIAAIKSGVPTAIFEDPLPLIQGGVTGTYEPRRNNQQGGGPGQPLPLPPEKGDISKLWDLLECTLM